MTIALAPLGCYSKASIDSKGDFAPHIQPLRVGILPVLSFEVKGPDRVFSDPDGPYDHPGVALEKAYLKNLYAGACALKNIAAIKRAAERPADTYLGKILAFSIETTANAVPVACHWITFNNGKDQYWSRRTHTPVPIYHLLKV